MGNFSVPTTRFVYFDEAGEITAISNNKQNNDRFIVVDLNEVYNLIVGKEVLSNYIVMYDPITKQNVLRHRFIEEEIQFDINNQIYKVPTVSVMRPDFTLQQDTKNYRWNLKLDEVLEESIKNQTVKFSSKLNFSITKRNDPHVLYNYFIVDLENYSPHYNIPFASDLELDVDNVSVYTTKRLETYYHEVLE